jgi:hypothetical protein
MNNIMSMEEYKKKISKVGNKKGSPEHDEQVRVFEWAEVVSLGYPELELLLAIPNGAYYGGHWGTANKMKAEGVKKGVPDIFLPVPLTRNFYNEETQQPDLYMKAGLWIEMKVGNNKPSEQQEWWIDKLLDMGYEVKVCYGADEAIQTISEYLSLDVGVNEQETN